VHWWELEEWHPRCDLRIPLSPREPLANYGASPGNLTHPWLRSAAKWHLGTMLEAGTLRWTTVSQERLSYIARVSGAGLGDVYNGCGRAARALDTKVEIK
jgi:hypothetical protein